MMDLWNSLLGAIFNNKQDNSLLVAFVTIGLVVTFSLIYYFKGRFWAFLYFLTIPFLNWSFGVVSSIRLVEPGGFFAQGVELHPLTIVTGLVFVFRDFVQRRMGHRVLIVMALAIAWSFFYAWPVIALASGIAFAISEIIDWLIFTFTKYRLSTRIILSSAVAAPVDTTIFLYGADLARQIKLGDEPGNMLHFANWIVFIIGKMVGAVIISYMIRQREKAGEIDPYDDDGFTPATVKS
ncbi:VUT family protein [Henriciella sp.]|uniref:VUT family protein n=1 Tax=Henriciella sp. TaxID=1968823 RepID=UPI0026040C9F|nr:VUT family protein [Henriciella sp.]